MNEPCIEVCMPTYGPHYMFYVRVWEYNYGGVLAAQVMMIDYHRGNAIQFANKFQKQMASKGINLNIVDNT